MGNSDQHPVVSTMTSHKIEIVRYECECDQSCCHYYQYDVVVDGVADTGWRDTLREAIADVCAIDGFERSSITYTEGGWLPEDRE